MHLNSQFAQRGLTARLLVVFAPLACTVNHRCSCAYLPSQPPAATSPRSLKASLPDGCSLLILYGSNMGTCEAYAKDMANQVRLPRRVMGHEAAASPTQTLGLLVEAQCPRPQPLALRPAL